MRGAVSILVLAFLCGACGERPSESPDSGEPARTAPPTAVARPRRIGSAFAAPVGLGREPPGQHWELTGGYREDEPVDWDPFWEEDGGCPLISRDHPPQMVASVLDESSVIIGEGAVYLQRFGYSGIWMVSGCAPRLPGVRRLVVHDGAVAYLDVVASAAAPSVRIQPLVANGTLDRTVPDVIRWEVIDADGDPFWVRLATSLDGRYWTEQLSGRRPGGPLERSSDMLWLDANAGLDHLWVRVEVFDGFWTARDVVGPIAVRDCTPPEGSTSPDACDAARRAP